MLTACNYAILQPSILHNSLPRFQVRSAALEPCTTISNATQFTSNACNVAGCETVLIADDNTQQAAHSARQDTAGHIAEVDACLQHASNSHSEGSLTAIPQTLCNGTANLINSVWRCYEDELLDGMSAHKFSQVPNPLWGGVLIGQQSVCVFVRFLC